MAAPVVFLFLASCEQHVEPIIPRPQQPTQGSPAALVDINLPPISTFEQSCSHCHGRAGALFILPFDHQGTALKQIVEEMLIGPAQLSPSTADVGAMVIYHEALADNKPFVIITNAKSFKSGVTSTLRGEASQGAAVRIMTEDGNTREVASDSVGWYLEDAPCLPLIVQVESQKGVGYIRLE